MTSFSRLIDNPIAFVLLIVAGFLCWPPEHSQPQVPTSEPAAPSMTANGDGVAIPVQVENVKIAFLPSSPVRVQIVAQGHKVPEVGMDVKQERKGTEITVTLTQTYVQRGQPRLVPFQQNVFLAGGFASGTYALRVNNYSTTFEVR